MRGIVHSTAVVFATAFFGQAAFAADFPVKAPMAPAMAPLYNWTGLYLGVNAGWAGSRNSLSTTVDPASNMNATARTAITNAGNAQVDSDGFIGGAQVGYNWQVNPSWLLGFEADIDYLSNKATRDTNNVVEPASGRVVHSIDEIRYDWLATVRARAGFTANRLLVYVTGGLALTQINISKSFSWDFIDGCPLLGGLNNCHVGGNNQTRAGWTLGGGLEYAVANNWSIKAEYLYADFGSVSYRTTNIGIGPSQTADHSVKSQLHVLRVGLNYKF